MPQEVGGGMDARALSDEAAVFLSQSVQGMILSRKEFGAQPVRGFGKDTGATVGPIGGVLRRLAGGHAKFLSVK